MSRIIKLPTHTDKRGSLTVLEREIPFFIRRVYYIWGNTENFNRGGHAHKKNIQAMVATSGSCEVNVKRDGQESNYRLDSPESCLLVEPEDWHAMRNFTKDCVLLVLASEAFDPDDYVSQA